MKTTEIFVRVRIISRNSSAAARAATSGMRGTRSASTTCPAPTSRPLHVLQVIRGEIKVVVVKPGEGGKEGDEPVVLVRSYAEMGYDHYDLVEAV